jgi:hypothetical protein
MDHVSIANFRSMVDSQPWGNAAASGPERLSYSLEREIYVVRVLTKDATLRRSFRDDHTTVLNRGD